MAVIVMDEGEDLFNRFMVNRSLFGRDVRRQIAGVISGGDSDIADDDDDDDGCGALLYLVYVLRRWGHSRSTPRCLLTEPTSYLPIFTEHLFFGRGIEFQDWRPSDTTARCRVTLGWHLCSAPL